MRRLPLLLMLAFMLLPLASAGPWNGISPFKVHIPFNESTGIDYSAAGNGYNYSNYTGAAANVDSGPTVNGSLNLTGTTGRARAASGRFYQVNETQQFVFSYIYRRNNGALLVGSHWVNSPQESAASQYLQFNRNGAEEGVAIASSEGLPTLACNSTFALNDGKPHQIILMRNETAISLFTDNKLCQASSASGWDKAAMNWSGTPRFGDDGQGGTCNNCNYDNHFFQVGEYLNGTSRALLYNGGNFTNYPLNASGGGGASPSITGANASSVTNNSAFIGFTIGTTAGNYSIALYNSSGIVMPRNNATYSLGLQGVLITGLHIYTAYFFNVTSCSVGAQCTTVGQYSLETLTTNATLAINYTDDFNGSLIGGLTINVSNASGVQRTLTSTHGAQTTLVIAQGPYNITAASVQYLLNRQVVNATDSGVTYGISAIMWGSSFNVSAGQVITNNTLPLNLSASNGMIVRNYTGSLNYTIYLPALVAGVLNGTSQAYFGQTITTTTTMSASQAAMRFNLSNNNLTIQARDLAGSPIGIYNITLRNMNYSFSVQVNNSGAGNISVPLLLGLAYNITISSVGAGTVTTSVTGNATQQALNVVMILTNNSAVLFNVYDEDTGLYIGQVANVSAYIDLISPAYAANVSTTSAALLSDVLPGGYRTYSYASGYNPRSYYFEVANQTASTVDLYLLNASRSSYSTISVVDINAIGVVNATVKVLRYYLPLNSFQIVGMVRTDQNGNGQFDLVPNTVLYQFMVEYAGRTLYVSIPTQYSAASIIKIPVDITQDYIGSIKNLGQVQSSLVYNNATGNVTWTWNNIQSVIVSSELKVTQTTPWSGTVTICDYVINASAGSTVCDVSAYTGAMVATGLVTVLSGDASAAPFTSKVLTFVRGTRQNAAQAMGRTGIAFAAMAIMGIVGMSLFSPGFAIFASALALIWTIQMGLWMVTASVIMGILVVAGIFMWRSGERE